MGILSLPFCHRWYASPSPLDPPRLGLQRLRIQTLAHGPSHGPSWWRSPPLRHTSGNDPGASPPWSPTRSLLWTTSLDPSSFPQNATKSLRLSVLFVALARTLTLPFSRLISHLQQNHSTTKKKEPNFFLAFLSSLFLQECQSTENETQDIATRSHRRWNLVAFARSASHYCDKAWKP